MARRALVPVALCLLLVLAGCSAPGSLSMDRLDGDADLAAHASVNASDVAAHPDGADARLLRDALRNGSATMDARAPPLRVTRPLDYRGAYYALSWNATGERDASALEIEVDRDVANATGPRVAYDDLPAPDRRALADPLSHLARVDDRDAALGASVVYAPDELNASLLAATPTTVVAYRNASYRVRASARTVDVTTYRYRTTLLANDTAAFADGLRERYRFTLRNLTDDERAVVEDAIDGGYYAEDTDDDAFRSLRERFRRHDPVRGDEYGGDWLVRYRGDAYWATLRDGGFDA